MKRLFLFVLLMAAVSYGAWSGDIQFTTNDSTSIHWVSVPKQAEMAADYSNIRFADSSGNDLPYWIDSSTVDTAWCHVGFPVYVDSGTVFRCIFGEGGAVNMSTLEGTYFNSGFTGINFNDRYTSVLHSTPDTTLYSDQDSMYAAWPSAKRLTDTSFIAVFRMSDEEIHTYSSTSRLMAVIFKANTNRTITRLRIDTLYDEALADERDPGLMVDGNVVIATWTNWWPENKRSNRSIRSTDYGITWESSVLIDSGSSTASAGDPQMFSDGNIYYPFYWSNNPNYMIGIAKSTDTGATWSAQIIDTLAEASSETYLIETKTSGVYSGASLLLVRRDDGTPTWRQYNGSGYCTNWSGPTPWNGGYLWYNANPPRLKRLNNGHIMAVSGNQNGGEVFVSKDEGGTWKEWDDYVSIWPLVHGVKGYPSPIQINDTLMAFVWCDNFTTGGLKSSINLNWYNLKNRGPKIGASPSAQYYPGIIDEANSWLKWYRDTHGTLGLLTTDSINGYVNPVRIRAKLNVLGFMYQGTKNFNADGNNRIGPVWQFSQFVAEQNNDGYAVSSLGITKGSLAKMRIDWKSDTVAFYYNGAFKAGKGAGNLNGVPNFNAWALFNWTSASPETTSVVDNFYVAPYTATDPVASVGTVTDQAWSFDPVTEVWTSLAAVAIDSISPDTVEANATHAASIYGTQFGATQGAVEQEGTPITVSSWSDTLIAVTLASNAGGMSGVSVITSEGDTATDSVYYYRVPSIASISPSHGTYRGGDTVTITGSQFMDSTASSAVKFGDSTTTIVPGSWTDTSVQVIIKAGTGTVAVSLTNADGYSDTLANAYTYDPKPSITAISPETGSRKLNNTVTISGTGFLGTQGDGYASIQVADSAITIISWSATSIRGTTRLHAAGTHDVIVFNANGDGDTLTAAFTTDSVPVITSISPSKGPPEGGTTVTIAGVDFEALQGTGSVLFGATEADSYTSWADDEVVVVSPTGDGSVSVILTTNTALSDTTTFKYSKTNYLEHKRLMFRDGWQSFSKRLKRRQ